jgi:hypothetical protein
LIAARSAVAAPEKIDYFWDKLAADRGEPNVCGWLRDKFRPAVADRAEPDLGLAERR